MAAVLLYSSLSLLFLILAFKLLFQERHKNLPPTVAGGLPVIGHLHLLKDPIHRTFQSMSLKYGPIFSLRFGSRLVVVVQSAAGAEECFNKNDIILANRPKLLMGKHLGYNHSTLVTSPYGEHWRNLRRIGALEIFSTSRLNTFLSIRRDEIRLLLRSLSRDSLQDYAKVNLKTLFLELNFNIIMRMSAGKRYYGYGEGVEDAEKAKHFRQIMREIVESGGSSHPGDFMPILKLVGGLGFEKVVIDLSKRMDAMLQGLVDEQRVLKNTNTIIGHMLELQETDDTYTDQTIKGIIMVVLIAGIDTTAIQLEWTMANLLKYPNVQKKARAEIDSLVGQDRLMDEPDIHKLPYLQNVHSESLRLHPATPMLVPHMPSEDITIGGYNIPRDTMLIANAWAIHRDPTLWEDPNTFKPERYESGESEAYKLMPFGLGRRACPAITMVHRVAGLTIGSLIQCFDWEKVGEKEIDMSEGKGLTMPKTVPLEAMCKARPIMTKLAI